MAEVPPGQPIAPGIASGDTYPQWGVSQQGTKYLIKEATSAGEKQTDINAGYLTWFSSQKAAQEFVSSETSILNGQVPNPLSGWHLSVSGIAGWFFRALKVLFGGILMIVGIAKLTGADNKITQLASKIPVVPV